VASSVRRMVGVFHMNKQQALEAARQIGVPQGLRRALSALRCHAGGGTRTPDTRIMIASRRIRGVRAVAGVPLLAGISGVATGPGLRAISVASADILLTPGRAARQQAFPWL
jgi:hypothetical protein